MDAQELKDSLSTFYGTENYYMLLPGLLMTDGVKYLADNAKAYWLMDMIWSYLPTLKRKRETFALVRYAGQPGGSGLFSITDDDPAHITYATQAVEYSDFPLDEIRLYLSLADEGRFVVMLTSEY